VNRQHPLVPVCRACRARGGELVLDLGEQPATDYFPAATDTADDPRHPLRVWLCSSCGLAQLPDEVPVPVEPTRVESQALATQAADAVARVAASGLLRAGMRVTEFGSGHAASWLPLLAARELVPVTRGEAERAPVDVVIDAFGLTHSPDQATALAERTRRLAATGVLLLQYQSFPGIVRTRQWNVVRHGHFAYHCTEAMLGMLRVTGLAPVTAWRFDLYGETVLLAARRGGTPDGTVAALLAEESAGPHPGTLARWAERSATELRTWLERAAADGRAVLGYGAAARAVVLLNRAGIDRNLLPAVVDGSTRKWGKRIPGTRIPVISPAELTAARPDVVLVFVPELLRELRVTHAELPAQWLVPG
jgi:C-methyltransferase-like protein/putative zinc binding protein